MRWLPGDPQSRTTIRDTLVAVARDPNAAAPRLALLDPAELDIVLRHGTEQRLGTSLAMSLRSASLTVPAWLEIHRFQTATRRASIMNGLAMIAPALADSRIPWVVMKGPVIAASFSSFEQREFADLDILVPGDRLAEVLKILAKIGIDDLNHNWEAYLRYEVAEFPVFVAGMPIDLHWHFVGLGKVRRRFTVNVREVLDRRYTTTINGIRVNRLDAEDHAIQVALHAGLSGAHEIGLLRDVHETIQASNLEWDELVSRSVRFGVAPLVGHVFDRSVRVLGSPVPPEIVSDMVPNSSLALRRRLDSTSYPWHGDEENIYSGFLISASRSGLGNSAARSSELLGERAAGWFGHSPRWSAYDPQSPLYWSRSSSDVSAIARYLEFTEGSS